MAHIDELIETEHKLRQQLHQQASRRCRRSGSGCGPPRRRWIGSWNCGSSGPAAGFGENPDEAAPRPVGEVEGYQQ